MTRSMSGHKTFARLPIQLVSMSEYARAMSGIDVQHDHCGKYETATISRAVVWSE